MVNLLTALKSSREGGGARGLDGDLQLEKVVEWAWAIIEME